MVEERTDGSCDIHFAPWGLIWSPTIKPPRANVYFVYAYAPHKPNQLQKESARRDSTVLALIFSVQILSHIEIERSIPVEQRRGVGIAVCNSLVSNILWEGLYCTPKAVA